MLTKYVSDTLRNRCSFLTFTPYFYKLLAKLKPPLFKTLLIITSPGCLSFTVQNDVCAEFDTRKLLKWESFSVLTDNLS